jgi:hypothetical protein
LVISREFRGLCLLLRQKNITTEKNVSDDVKIPITLKVNRLKNSTVEQHVGEDENRPKNLRANVLPTEGYGLEIDGRVKSQYNTAEAAASAGLELKRKYPFIQIVVFDAKQRTRTVVELPT